MSDHIPLSEARPGDIVHLKPMMVDRVSIDGSVTVGRFEFPPSVTRPPVALEPTK